VSTTPNSVLRFCLPWRLAAGTGDDAHGSGDGAHVGADATPESPCVRVSGQREMLHQQQASMSIWRGRYLAPVIAIQSSLSSAVRLAMVI
jgi:hypothetical protein